MNSCSTSSTSFTASPTQGCTRLIGIVGGTCSGKTSVAAELGFPVVSQESWYKGLTDNEKGILSDINWDHPNRIDFDSYITTLRLMKAGESPLIPIYDYEIHAPNGSKQVINNKGTILVEGIFVGYTQEERDLFDAIFFVDVAADERLIRRIRRGRSTRTVDETMIQWERFVRPGHDQFIEPLKKYADIIIPGGVRNTIAMDMIREWLKNHEVKESDNLIVIHGDNHGIAQQNIHTNISAFVQSLLKNC